MRNLARHMIVAATASLLGLQASGESASSVIGVDLYAAALNAKTSVEHEIENPQYTVIIDYRVHSMKPRFFLIDTEKGTTESFLVAHGQGSDLDHDGFADSFSNVPQSKMTSLGTFVTGETYYGRHGLSLRLHGLSPENDNAEKRATVIHGADCVSPGRRVLGRSWGCPSLERDVAERGIPLIKNGAYVFAIGPSETDAALSSAKLDTNR